MWFFVCTCAVLFAYVVCLCVYLFVCPFPCLYVFFSSVSSLQVCSFGWFVLYMVCLWVCPSIRFLFVCLFTCPPVCLFVCLFTCPPVCLFVCLFTCPPVCLFVCLFSCPPLCLFVSDRRQVVGAVHVLQRPCGRRWNHAAYPSGWLPPVRTWGIIRCNSVRYGTVLRETVRCSTVRWGTVRYNTRHSEVRCWEKRYDARRCGEVRYDASCCTVRCNTVQCGDVLYGAVRYGTIQYGTVRWGTVWCGTVLHRAVTCVPSWYPIMTKRYFIYSALAHSVATLVRFPSLVKRLENKANDQFNAKN